MQPKKLQKNRKGFTLVELLAVMGIMMVLAGVIIAIKPGNPEGLGSAQRMAIATFEAARNQAVMGRNPDQNPDINKLYNFRSRILVLRDPDNPEEHLRLMRIVIGGTRNADETESSNYYWYVFGTDTILPPETYYVDPDEGSIPENRRSRITNRDGLPRTTRLNHSPSIIAQADGSGDREWYFYEFNGDGTSNMFAASCMISQGDWDPVGKRVMFRNKNNVVGFVILPSGRTIGFSDTDEMEKGNTL